jgi:hypothetical protein
LRRKHRLEKLPWKEISGTGKTGTQDEFFDLYKQSADSLANRSVFLDISMEISSPEKPLHAGLVAAVSDSSGNSVFYEMIQLDWLQNEWKPGDIFHHGLYIYHIPENARDLTVYFWNIKKKKYTLNDFRVKISFLKDNK